jgi:low temperature requirement protein LtrA
MVLTGPLLVVGGLLHGGWRIGLWALAGLVDLAAPALLRRRLALVRFHPEHLPERFGLFLIIALGESIVAVGASAAPDPLNAGRLSAVAGAFALACALWWLYFAFAADAVRYAVSTAEVQTDIIRQVLAYGHLALIGAIIGVAVGLAEVVAHPAVTLPAGVCAVLVGGCALYLLTFVYTRWRMFRTMGWSRLAAGMLCGALLPALLHAPALATLGALATVLIGLNAVEALIIRPRMRDRRAAVARESTPALDRP